MNAYLVLDLTIHDMESFTEYVEKIPAVISKHNENLRGAGTNTHGVGR